MLPTSSKQIKKVSFLLFLLWWNVHSKHLHNSPLQHCSPSPQLLSLASNTPDHHTGNPGSHPLESSGTKEPRASLFNHFRLKKDRERKDFTEAVEDGKSEPHPGQRWVCAIPWDRHCAPKTQTWHCPSAAHSTLHSTSAIPLPALTLLQLKSHQPFPLLPFPCPKPLTSGAPSTELIALSLGISLTHCNPPGCLNACSKQIRKNYFIFLHRQRLKRQHFLWKDSYFLHWKEGYFLLNIRIAQGATLLEIVIYVHCSYPGSKDAQSCAPSPWLCAAP